MESKRLEIRQSNKLINHYSEIFENIMYKSQKDQKLGGEANALIACALMVKKIVIETKTTKVESE